MNAKALIRNPLIAAVLGAAFVAAPVSVLYAVGVAARAAVTAPAPVTPVPATGNPAAVLPDFSSMVQKYGPAVVNISVVTKTSAAYSPDGDDSDDNPFGPNSPFAPFFRGLPFQAPQPGPVHLSSRTIGQGGSGTKGPTLQR